MKVYKTDVFPKVICYHCGQTCNTHSIQFDDKDFCCDGCRLVYDLLKDHNMCTYYNMNKTPGATSVNNTYSGKYNYLDNTEITTKLVQFTDENITSITFYIPKIHCSSCIWLLENVHRLNSRIISSSVNFLRKEAILIYKSNLIKLSEVVELLAQIGYEPLINLKDLDHKPKNTNHKNLVLKIGITGFCFGNIMMLSFPEYFAVGNFYDEKHLSYFFGYLNLFLSLPVLVYGASDFFVSAWKSLRYRYLNIDAPIALAILVTFLRSAYEIISHKGVGYMDSMSGIVFFMLIGRYFQNKTYETLSFERDYKSYFPIGVCVKKENGNEVNQPISQLKKGDIIIIRNNELIPTDTQLLSEYTYLDYSFITGESTPIKKQHGDIIYAGGKQLEGAITLKVIRPISQSYLTQLWNKDTKNQQIHKSQSYIDKINKYFTISILSISVLSAMFWMFTDSTIALNALTAVLIVACPCGLLLTTTFANGNVMRIYGRNKFYLKNPTVIEKLAKADTLVFDKTGTITHGVYVSFRGPKLSEYQLQLIVSLAAQSSHPLSRSIHKHYESYYTLPVNEFQESIGNGIRGCVDNTYLMMGSEFFVTGKTSVITQHSKVFLMIEGKYLGYFYVVNSFRKGLRMMIQQLSKSLDIKLISGDNDSEIVSVSEIFGYKADLLFNQKPKEKMLYIKNLQQQGKNVIMLGDGLNDIGALKQSDIGIAVSDDTNNFSPASDAILDGSSFTRIPEFLQLARINKKIITSIFIISLVYNIIGLSFAVQGILSPVIAAILMPLSSISIVVLTTGITNVVAWYNKL